MTIVDATLPQHGTMLGGQMLRQADDDSLHALYQLGNLGCGLTYETGPNVPYLRLTPAVQIPGPARESLVELFFTHPDERFADVRLDRRDGEVTMRRTVSDPDRLEAELADCLEFVNDVMWPALLEHVASHKPGSRDDGAVDDDEGEDGDDQGPSGFLGGLLGMMR